MVLFRKIRLLRKAISPTGIKLSLITAEPFATAHKLHISPAFFFPSLLCALTITADSPSAHGPSSQAAVTADACGRQGPRECRRQRITSRPGALDPCQLPRRQHAAAPMPSPSPLPLVRSLISHAGWGRATDRAGQAGGPTLWLFREWLQRRRRRPRTAPASQNSSLQHHHHTTAMNTNTLPPPPLHPLHPPPPASPSSPSYPARQLQQRAQAPPAIYTNVPAAYTPASAVPGSAVVASASRPFRISPSSAMSYNPQEWGRAGQVSGAYVPHTAAAAQARARGTREMTGMERTSRYITNMTPNGKD